MTAYESLSRHYAIIGKLEGANSLLFWDRNVVMRPGSAPAHGEVAGALATVLTEKMCDPALAGLLDQAESQAGTLDAWQRANLAEMRRLHRHATAVPAATQVRKAQLSATLNQTWLKARAASDFKLFEPGMKEMLELVREIAAHKSAALGLAPYDALMDEYDPGTTCALVDRVFQPLGRELPGILNAALEQQASWKLLPLPGPFPAARQQELCEALMRRIGYHFDHGRLDPTPHPFALPRVPGDQRITTRYKEDDLRFAIMATLHETGHSFYEFNLPRAWSFQPVGLARGASLHESQSLMLEMAACRTPQFVQLLAPMLAERFGPGDPAYGYDNLLKHYRRISRNLIRIEADQVVYPLHIILRYELERELLDGAVKVRDIPAAWQEKMRRLIGLVPDGDANGCLQDVHWSFGMFGYFPSYGLGAAISAQLFEAALRDDAAILDGIAAGDFTPYFDWVRPRVHEKAASEPLEQIVREATGAPIGADALLRQLKQRYL